MQICDEKSTKSIESEVLESPTGVHVTSTCAVSQARKKARKQESKKARKKERKTESQTDRKILGKLTSALSTLGGKVTKTDMVEGLRTNGKVWKVAVERLKGKIKGN